MIPPLNLAAVAATRPQSVEPIPEAVECDRWVAWC